MSDVILFDPRPQQMAIHRALERARFGVVVCHRRMGKTVLAVNQLIRSAITCDKERPRFGYLAPTYTQGKSTAFDYLQAYSADIAGAKVNQSELRVDFSLNGGQVRIYGADNPDSLRGLYFDGVVLDEHGLHQNRTFSEVVLPTLVDRGGWALIMGTPNGKNQFFDVAMQAKREEAAGNDWFYLEFKASQTKLLDRIELERAKAMMTPDEYAQEFECSWEAAVKGSIFAKEMQAAREAGRITAVPYDSALPVNTDWDLGIGDAMAIWFSQSTRSGEVRLIDYLESSGEGFPFYIQALADKGYTYGQHWAPHDIQVRELGSGSSRLEVAQSLGLRFQVTPRLHGSAGNEVEEGIHAARMLFSRCWFDAEKCRHGLDALTEYRRDYNARLNEFKPTPVHDWASHGADAFRGLAVRHKTPVEKKKRRAAATPREWAWG